ncbi:hypothetical protein EGH56_23640 [Klebsiella aerogenes]|nr:hypothetical protein EGH56_23640 [Klebsiella aerogenes]
MVIFLLIIHDGHLNLAQSGHYNFAVTTTVRIIYLMLNDLSSVIIIIAARLKPEQFDLPGQSDDTVNVAPEARNKIHSDGH